MSTKEERRKADGRYVYILGILITNPDRSLLGPKTVIQNFSGCQRCRCNVRSGTNSFESDQQSTIRWNPHEREGGDDSRWAFLNSIFFGNAIFHVF